MPTRRTLLAGAAGAGMLGALAACSQADPTAAPSPGGTATPAPSATTTATSTGNGRRVIVVGAGAAGLAAAVRLAEGGATVTVLEARDRIGGRVFTSSAWPDLAMDMGASWIHGPDGNPLTPLAAAAGAKTISTSYDSGTAYVAASLRAQGLSEPNTDLWESRVEAALAAAGTLDADVSIAQALERTTWWSGLRETERADLAFYLSATSETEWGEQVARLSAWTVDDDKEYAGDDRLFPAGFGAVMTYLARGLDVRLSSPVTAVSVEGREVVVEVGGASERADAVIVTVPLGVLKTGRLRIEPGLSTAAQTAIGRIGVGVLSKTFLRFERAFWPTDIDWHEFVGPQPGLWSEWVSFAKAGAPVLLGFNAGDHARRIEAAAPAAVSAEAMATLREMFGTGIPEPTAVLTSSWSTDQWALGSYSAATVGSTRADRLALAAPVGERIFWAGEATEPDHHSTVHGAVLSGRRAADEALRAVG